MAIGNIANNRHCQGGELVLTDNADHHSDFSVTASSPLRCIRMALPIVKHALRVPTFTQGWYGLARLVDVCLEKCNLIQLKHEYQWHTLSVKAIYGQEPDTTLSVLQLSPRKVDNNKTSSPVALFVGGGYLFSPAMQLTSTASQYADAGYDVWIPNYSRLSNTERDKVSERNLAEAATLIHFLSERYALPKGSILLAGDSSGADVVLRLLKYQATRGTPHRSRVELRSPAYLDGITEGVALPDYGELLLPPHQLKDLKTQMRHKPVTHYLPSIDTAIETFKGTGPILITADQHEALSPVIENLVKDLRSDNVPVTYHRVSGTFHSQTMVSQWIPESRHILTTAIDWQSQQPTLHQRSNETKLKIM